jgi:iron complex outermembrane receptor protein
MKRVASLSLALSSLLYAADTTLEPISISAQEEALHSDTPALDMAASSPGIDMRRTTGKPQEITIHGLGGEDLAITTEGGATHGACPGRMDPPLSHLNTARIDRIETTKGPFNVRQPGVMGGGAEVKTKPLPTQRTLEAKAGAASFGRTDLELYGGEGNDRFGVAAGIVHHASGIYKDGDGNELSDVQPGYKDNITDEKLYSKQGAFIQAGAHTEAFTAAIEYDRLDTDHALFPTRKMDETMTETTQIAASLKGRSGAFEGVNLRLYQNTVDHVMDNHTFRNAMMKMDAKGESTVSGVLASKHFSAGDRHFELGLEHQIRTWDIGRFNGTSGAFISQMIDTETTLTGLYGIAAVPMKKDCDLEVGVRVDSVEIEDGNTNATNLIEGAGLDYSDSSSDTLFGAYLKRTQRLSEEWRFIAALGTAQRTVAPDEAYIQHPSSRGNPQLKSPRNSQLDLTLARSGAQWQMETTLFYSQLKDAIYEKAQGSVTSYENIDATMSGLDLQMAYRLDEAITLKAMAAWQQGRKDEAANGSDNLAGMPPVRGGLHALYRADRWKASLELEAAGSQSDVDTGLGETKLDGWQTVALRGEYRLAKGLMLQGGIENLTDEHYARYNAYDPDPVNPSDPGSVLAEPGRTLYAALHYRY